jgi:hypothetical protein
MLRLFRDMSDHNKGVQDSLNSVPASACFPHPSPTFRVRIVSVLMGVTCTSRYCR